ncbi:threonine synthase [Candidatus Bathyarchaeota archaeon]|nr:threonine synthase [Candidatus Bathyarchaeota archaeon]
MCRECGAIYPLKLLYACEKCFAPLDVSYNLENIKVTREEISQRKKNIWRYRELLPLENYETAIDLGTGLSTLHKAENLGRQLGLTQLYIKDDTVNPTNSFKDRPASVAISKAKEFGVKAVGCPSTGNLAASVAAHSAKAGLPCYIFVPSDTELTKILQASIFGANIIPINGTYDEANRLAAQVAEHYDWAFANINLRSYYVEGSKSIVFEICEQLNWETPDTIIIPLGSGALYCAIYRGLKQFKKIGLIEDKPTRLVGAQAEGCAPIASSFKEGLDDVIPIENPNTIAKSLAIGDPGDGYYVLRYAEETGGTVEAVSDEEILEAIKLVASKEGIFTEPAGGVTIAVLKKLVATNYFRSDEKVVCAVTGSGFKAADTLVKTLKKPFAIDPNLNSFIEWKENYADYRVVFAPEVIQNQRKF